MNDNYKNIYESKIIEIYENTIREKLDCRIIYGIGKKLSETNNTKKKIFNYINKEIKNYIENNKDNFSIELQNYNEEKKQKLTSTNFIINDDIEDELNTTINIIEEENKKEDTSEEKKTEIYKINYKDIFILKDIKKRYISESLKFFTLNIIDYLKEILNNDFIKKHLNILIEEKIKNDKNLFK